jgi:hypothetical protein
MPQNNPELIGISSVWKRLRLTMTVVFLFFAGFCFYTFFSNHFIHIWHGLVMGENNEVYSSQTGWEMMWKGLMVFTFGCYFAFMAWYINKSQKHLVRGLLITLGVLGVIWIYARSVG